MAAALAGVIPSSAPAAAAAGPPPGKVNFLDIVRAAAATAAKQEQRQEQAEASPPAGVSPSAGAALVGVPLSLGTADVTDSNSSRGQVRSALSVRSALLNRGETSALVSVSVPASPSYANTPSRLNFVAAAEMRLASNFHYQQLPGAGADALTGFASSMLNPLSSGASTSSISNSAMSMCPSAKAVAKAPLVTEVQRWPGGAGSSGLSVRVPTSNRSSFDEQQRPPGLLSPAGRPTAGAGGVTPSASSSAAAAAAAAVAGAALGSRNLNSIPQATWELASPSGRSAVRGVLGGQAHSMPASPCGSSTPSNRFQDGGYTGFLMGGTVAGLRLAAAAAAAAGGGDGQGASAGAVVGAGPGLGRMGSGALMRSSTDAQRGGSPNGEAGKSVGAGVKPSLSSMLKQVKSMRL